MAAPSEPLEHPPTIPSVEASVPEFARLTPTTVSAAGGSLDHLMDLTVLVTAELGRVTLTVADVLKLAVGSVLELDRAISEPVDLTAQGVRIARGEVVVVDGSFAIRIKEISDPKKKPAGG